MKKVIKMIFLYVLLSFLYSCDSGVSASRMTCHEVEFLKEKAVSDKALYCTDFIDVCYVKKDSISCYRK